MAARTSSPTFTPVTKTPVAKTTASKAGKRIEPTHSANVEEPTQETLYERARESVQQLLDGLQAPSWIKRAASTLIALTVGASVAYGSMALLDMLLIGVIAYTGLGFISFLVAFIGMVGVVFASMNATIKVFEFCHEFSWARTKSRFSAFVRTSVEPAAAR